MQYSLERGQKICAVLMDSETGAMKKTNLLVTSIGEDGFIALLPGRKKESSFSFEDVLTATYARGDQGALE